MGPPAAADFFLRAAEAIGKRNWQDGPRATDRGLMMIFPVRRILDAFNPRSHSAAGKLQCADWIAAARVKVYWIAGTAAEYVYGWLHGRDTVGLPWYWIVAIGCLLGLLDLLRRKSNDYSGRTSDV